MVQPGIYKKNNDVIRTTMAAGFAGPLKGSRVLDEPQSVRFLGSDTAVVITEGGVLMAGVRPSFPPRAWFDAPGFSPNGTTNWYVVAYQNSPAN